MSTKPGNFVSLHNSLLNKKMTLQGIQNNSNLEWIIWMQMLMLPYSKKKLAKEARLTNQPTNPAESQWFLWDIF